MNQVTPAYAEMPNESLVPDVQSQNIQQSNNMAYQSRNEAALVKWQLEFFEILDDAEHKFKGEFLTQDGTYEERKGARLLNGQGVSDIMQLLSIYLNKNTILSDFSQDQINEMMFQLMNTLIDLIELRYKIYDLDKAKISLVLNIVEGAAISALYRAKNHTTLKFLKNNVVHTETYTKTDPRGGGGNSWLGGLFGTGK